MKSQMKWAKSQWHGVEETKKIGISLWGGEEEEDKRENIFGVLLRYK